MIRIKTDCLLAITILAVLVLFSNGCTPSQTNDVSYEYAIYQDEPVFEDEYLFPSAIKKGKARSIEEVDISLIDWNDNNEYAEIGTDYLGVKTHLDSKPVLQKLSNKNIVNLNGASYELILQGNTYELVKTKNTISDINLITQFTPIALEDGTTLDLDFKEGKTVIYFWATWCGPCVKTLKNLGPKMDQLAAEKIRFIPIAYNCSDYEEFINKHKLPYKAYSATEDAGTTYGLFNLPVQFTFDEDGKLAKENIDLKSYYSIQQ